MRHLFDSPLGAQIAPLGVPKNIGPLIPAIIGAVGALGSAAISGLSGQSNASTSFNRQKELLEKEQDWQKRMYDYSFQKESEYNSPQAAMLRYDAAGINPYLISQHSQMIGSGETRPSIPSPVGAPQVAQAPAWNVPIGESMQGIASALAASSQMKKNNAESLSKVADAVEKLGPTLGWDNARSIAHDLLGVYGVSDSQAEQKLNAYIDSLRLDNEMKQLNLEILRTYGPDKAALINQNLSLEGQHIASEIERIASDIKVNEGTIKEKEAKVKELEASVKELLSRAARNVAEKSHLEADAATINQLREYVVKSAQMKADMDSYDKIEMQTDFIQRDYARDWQRSDEGKAAATAAQSVADNPETNLINKVIRGKDPSRRGRR